MTDIHAFDADGTASPGAQAALTNATANLATKDEVAATADIIGIALDAKVDSADARLSDARPPLAHTHTAAQVTDLAGAINTATSALPTKAYVDGAVQSIATSGIPGVSPVEVRSALGAAVVVGGGEPADSSTPVLWINTRGPAFPNPTYPVSGYPIASDSFSRPDGALGTTEWGAKPWANTGGTVTVSTGRAKYASGAGDVYATVDSGALDVEVTTQIATLHADPRAGILARYSSDTRHLIGRTSQGPTLGYTIAQRYGAGNSISFLAQSAVVPKVGDIVTMRVVGTSVQLIVNGTLLLNATTSLEDGTRVGYWANAVDATTAHERFKVRGA